MEIAGSVQVIDQSGKYGPVQLVVWWYKTKKEFDQFTKTQPPLTGNATWSFFKFEKDE